MTRALLVGASEFICDGLFAMLYVRYKGLCRMLHNTSFMAYRSLSRLCFWRRSFSIQIGLHTRTLWRHSQLTTGRRAVSHRRGGAHPVVDANHLSVIQDVVDP